MALNANIGPLAPDLLGRAIIRPPLVAIRVIYIVLSVLYESFNSPITILSGPPSPIMLFGVANKKAS